MMAQRFRDRVGAVVNKVTHPQGRDLRWKLWAGVTALCCAPLCALLLWLALSPAPPLLEGIGFSPLVLDRQGQLLRMGLSSDEKFRARVTVAEIAPHAVQALLLYEDRYFYSHPGVNPLALARAVVDMARGGRRMGGSTITMQVARLRYNLGSTSIYGKLHQMLVALRLEWHYSKQELLEAYFCLAPYGGNVEGIAAASRIYFGRPPAHLTLAESLALTPVPQNPVRRWPLGGEQGGRDFRMARERMEKLWLAVYPQDAQSLAGGEGLSPLRILGPASLPFEAPHVSAAILAAVAGDSALPAQGPPQDLAHGPFQGVSQNLPPNSAHNSVQGPPQIPPDQQVQQGAQRPQSHDDQRQEASAQGQPPVAQNRNNLPPFLRERFARGVTNLYTTLSLPLQKMLEQRLASFAARGRVYNLNNAAAMVLHWPSMEIRALVGSARFSDVGILGQVDGTLARRSPGSTLKPFIYALALDQGLIHPQTLLVDSPRSFGGYDPENFDRSFRGPLPAHEALRASRNIPAIGLASRLSPDLYSFLQRADMRLPYSAEHYGLSLVLGGAEVRMRDLVELYAMLPNKGVWRPARLMRDDDSLVARSLLSPEAAVLTLHMLEEPGRELRTRYGAIPHRYKTGTSNRFRDAWTVGLLGPYILAVWVGNFDNSPNPLLVGGNVAAPLYEDIAAAISLRETLVDPVDDLHEGLNLLRVPVCTDTGDLDVSLCRDTTQTWYIPGRSPTRASHVYRTILVDSRTGLRACQPSAYTREEVGEFWPTDLQLLFARAGLVKASPPPYGPECAGQEGEAGKDSIGGGSQTGGQAAALNTGVDGAGNEPRILSPRDGVVYQRRVGDELSKRNAIPLIAGVDADVDSVFWFVNDRFVGRSVVAKVGGVAEGESLLWQPEDGTHVVRVVDNLGRAGARRVKVETLP